MNILELTLSGYKRLMLNNIKRLTLKPESIYQLILGTNGSGKSSVLAELGPLPANSSDYVKNGYKYIKIEHKGSIYELTSVFKSGNKHTFVKDGESLNQGRTGAVQKELVAQEFRITPEIHNLLIGAIDFTHISPAKRREWITRLCHVDFTYALGVHQKLKSAARDAQGALKHAKQRLGEEHNKLVNIGDLEALERQYQALHQELEVLFNERDNQAGDVNRLERQVDQALDEIEELSKVLITKAPTVPDGHVFKSIEEIDAALNELHTEKQVNTSLRSRIGSEHQELEQLVQSFEQAGVEDLDSIRDRQAELLDQQQAYQDALQHWNELKADPVEAQRSFYEVGSQLAQVLKDLPCNESNLYTRDKLKAARERLPEIEHSLRRSRGQLAQLESRLEHLLSLTEEQCPDCGYRWIPGKSDQEQAQLEARITRGREHVEKLEAEEKQCANYVEEAEHYSQQYYAFKQLTQQYPRLVDLWEALITDERLKTDSPALIGIIHDFGHDLERHVEIQGLQKLIDKLNSLLEAGGEGEQLNGLRKRLTTLDQQIEEVTQTLETLTARETQLSKYRQHISAYQKRVTRLDEKLDELGHLKDELVRSYRADNINQVIRQHQNQLAGVQGRRTEKQTLEGIIKGLEEDKEKLDSDHELLSELTSELSPLDGLIAEQLTGFIESFVDHINQVIATIWTYELKVLPCGLESGDLDYKFPLFVRHEGEDNTAPDIAKGSEAQVEVVNLAFRLVTMVYLELEDYPIYLDEAGRSFDEQHRLNLLNFIKRLVDTGNYTQLFIISHYVASFNVYNNAEVLVLDGTNISIPKDHNQHVIME